MNLIIIKYYFILEWNPSSDKSLKLRHRKRASECDELYAGLMYGKQK